MTLTSDQFEQEIKAIGTVVDAFEPLTNDQRRRVIFYLADVFGVQLPVTASVQQFDEIELIKRAAAWATDVLQMVDAKQLKQQLLELIKRAWSQQAATVEAVEAWQST
jgi:uncharacterized phage protein gp47/JayE